MKNKTLLLAIAILSIIATVIAALLDPTVFKNGVFIWIVMMVSFAALLFIFLTINYFALAFFVKQILKLFRKK
jgi:hypothetical protein